MICLWFAMMMMTAQAAKPAAPVVCGPPPVRSPSLLQVQNGQCPKGYVLKKDQQDRPIYCVNTVHPAPIECVTGPALPPAPAKVKTK